MHEGEGHRHVLGRVRPGAGDVVAAHVAAFQSDLHRVGSRGHVGDREGPIEGRRRRRAEGELLVRKADRGTAGADIARSERPVVIEVVVGGSLDGVRRNLQVPRHDPVGQAVPVEVRGGAHRLVHAHMERRAREGAAPDERGPRRGPDRGRDRDVSEGDEGAVMSVRIRRREVVRRPEFVRDRDADPGERVRSGGHRAVHPRAVIVPQEHDAIPHARDRGEVHEPLRLPRGDVLLEAARLVVVHRLIGIRVVPRIGEWIVVRGPVDDAEVGEVPRRRGRERLQGLSEARDPGLVRQPDLRRRVADVRPVEHRLVERRQIPDRRALDLRARRQVLDRDGRRARRRGPQDLEEIDREDPSVRELDHAVVRELHRRIEDARVLHADRKEPGIDREISDVPAGRISDGVVQGRDRVRVEVLRDQGREEHVHRVRGLHVCGPDAVPDGIALDDGNVVGRMQEDALEDVDLEAGPDEGRGDPGAEVRPVQPEIPFEEPDHQEGDRRGLVLGRDELARDRVPVLEVVRDRRVDAAVYGLEAVVPPRQERRPQFRGPIRVLRREPPPRGRIVLRVLRKAVPERAEVVRA